MEKELLNSSVLQVSSAANYLSAEKVLSPPYLIFMWIFPIILVSLAQLHHYLGMLRINLSNIQIIESREDVPGVLRFSFRNQEEADRASELLGKEYAVHV